MRETTVRPTSRPILAICAMLLSILVLSQSRAATASSAAFLEADRVGLIGGSEGARVVVSGDRLLAIADGHLQIHDLSNGSASRIGGSALPVDLHEFQISAFEIFDELVAIAEADGTLHLAVITDPAQPAFVGRLRIGINARHLAADGRTLYASGDAQNRTWLAVIDASDARDPQFSEAYRIPVDRLYSLTAGSGKIGMIVNFSRGGPPRIELWVLGRDPLLGRLVVTAFQHHPEAGWPSPASEVVDIDGDRLLVIREKAVHLLDLRALPELPALASWVFDRGHEVEGAHLHQDIVQLYEHRRDPQGPIIGKRYRRFRIGAGNPELVLSQDLPEGSAHFGDGRFCHQLQLIHCLTPQGRLESTLAFEALRLDRETTAVGNCLFDIDRSSAGTWVACHGRIALLRPDPDGQLRTIAAANTRLGTVIQLAVAADHAYALMERGQVAHLSYDGVYAISLTVLDEPAERIAAMGDMLLLIRDNDMVVLDGTTRAEISRVGIGTLSTRQMPIVDGSSVYILQQFGAKWLEVILRDPAAPDWGPMLHEFTGRQLMISDGLAYSLAGERVDGRDRLILSVHDIADSPPTLLERLDLSDDIPAVSEFQTFQPFVASDILYLSRDQGWVHRIDISQRGRLQRLAPQVFHGSSTAFAALDDHVGVMTSGGQFYEIEPNPEARPVMRGYWRSWRPFPKTPIYTDGELLFLAEKEFDADESVQLIWYYDMRRPEQPKRLTGFRPYDLAKLSRDGDRLYSTANRGLEVWSFDVSEPGRMQPEAIWCLRDGCPSAGFRPSPLQALTSAAGRVYTLQADGTLHILDGRSAPNMQVLGRLRLGAARATSTPSFDLANLRPEALVPARRARAASMYQDSHQGVALAVIDDRLIYFNPPAAPEIYTIDQPQRPGSRGRIEAAAGAERMVRLDQHLLFSRGNAVLLIDPSTARHVAELRLPSAGGIEDLTAAGQRIYARVGTTLWLLERTSPEGLSLIGKAPMGEPGTLLAMNDLLLISRPSEHTVEVWRNFRENPNASSIALPILYAAR